MSHTHLVSNGYEKSVAFCSTFRSFPNRPDVALSGDRGSGVPPSLDHHKYRLLA